MTVYHAMSATQPTLDQIAEHTTVAYDKGSLHLMGARVYQSLDRRLLEWRDC